MAQPAVVEAPYQQMLDQSPAAAWRDSELGISRTTNASWNAEPSGWCAGREGFCMCCWLAFRCCSADLFHWLCFCVRCVLPSLPQCCVLSCARNGSKRVRALETMMKRMAATVPRRLRALQLSMQVVEAIPLLRTCHLYLSGAGVQHCDVDVTSLPSGGEWLWPEEHGDFASAKKRGRLVLYIHGGAFVLCNPATHRSFTRNMVHATDALVLVTKYPQPPRFPFPASLDDIVHTYRQVLKQGYFKPSQIIVAGESAGGNLSLSLCLRLRPEEMPGGIVLISPWVDLTESQSELEEAWRHSKDFLEPDLVALFANAYVCGRPTERCLASDEFDHSLNPSVVQERLKLASPLHSENSFDDLPPTLLIYGSSEMLAKQNRELWAKRLSNRNTKHEIYEAANMVHAFPMLADIAYGGMGLSLVTTIESAAGLVLISFLSGCTLLILSHAWWDYQFVIGIVFLLVGLGVAAILVFKPEWIVEARHLEPTSVLMSPKSLLRNDKRVSQQHASTDAHRVEMIKTGETEQPAPYEAYRRISMFSKRIWNDADVCQM